ncbi:hypothetical protein FRZ67_01455 [Panacibacter ginsenosidivorans]|uniref:Outer membrane beta-barrel protein n=1 Tax=Panacibacter ginsenosidivorans TaxID=1813871 RepID=A0A5B8V4S8_9BACT|nr:hypothetical protein [Panacibacter ginsenosidivorans]QEC66035.1 hypothetical protein FRZ67_01455 [Panacibacter ginsenosidivorans]
MKLKFTGIFILLLATTTAIAQQQKALPRSNAFIDLSGTIGSTQGTVAVAYVYNLRTGKNRRLEAGLGLRNTVYLGTKKDFITAGPASLTRTSTTPFLIFFAGQREENFDTLTVQRPFTNSLNATINLGYNISKNFYAGFNIDLIGFTVGSKTSGIFNSNGKTTTEPVAKPAAFNLLLTGDHDYGSLNSEFFLKYKVADRWSVKALYQFIFIEYKTTTMHQIAADGTVITRFRNKANNFGIGVSYSLNKN